MYDAIAGSKLKILLYVIILPINITIAKDTANHVGNFFFSNLVEIIVNIVNITQLFFKWT